MSTEGENKTDPGDEGREAARDFFMTYFNTDWTGRDGRKEQRKAMREIVRLWQTYPDVYEEVLEHFDLDAEEWHGFRDYINKQHKRSDK